MNAPKSSKKEEEISSKYYTNLALAWLYAGTVPKFSPTSSLPRTQSNGESDVFTAGFAGVRVPFLVSPMLINVSVG